MSKIFLFIITVIIIMIIFTIPLWNFQYQGKVTNKQFIDSDYYLNRYKQSDIIINYDEYLNLKSINSDLTYISDAKYILYIDNHPINVKSNIYDSYEIGDSLIYYKKIFSPFIKLN